MSPSASPSASRQFDRGRGRSVAALAVQQRPARGVALLTVIMITALATTLVITLLTRHQLAVVRTSYSVTAAQAYEFALGAETYARTLLLTDFVEDREPPKTDTLGDIWAVQQAPFDLEQGTITLSVSDLQGRFNLNGLARQGRTQGLVRLRTMLTALGLPVEVADRIKDWVDQDELITGFGAEDSEYLIADPPHRAANRPLADVSELALLADLEPEASAQLRAAVAILPAAVNSINVNTAHPASLAALSQDLSLAEAEAFASADRAFEDPAEAIAALGALGPAVDALGVASSFFEVAVRVDLADVTVHLVSTIYRDPGTGATIVLSRNLGRPTIFAGGTVEDEPDN